MAIRASLASLWSVSAPKKKSKKPAPPAPGLSRGRRAMFLRIPLEHYSKLERMTAARFASGERDGIQGTVIRMIEQAPEKKP